MENRNVLGKNPIFTILKGVKKRAPSEEKSAAKGSYPTPKLNG